MKAIVLNKINYLLLSFYLVCLVFDFKIVNIALLLLLFTSVITILKDRESIYNNFKENVVVYSVVLLFFLYQLLHGVFNFELSEKRIGLLFLFIGSLFVMTRILDIRWFIKVFIGCLGLVVLGGCYNILNYYFQSEEFNLVAGAHINPMLIVDRPYLGFLLGIGIVLGFFMYNLEKKIGNTNKFWLFIPLIFFSYLIFVGNRVQLLSLIFLAFVYAFFYLKTTWKKKLYFSTFFLLGILSVFTLSDTLKQRFALASFDNEEIINSLAEKEPRVIIWKCTKSIWLENSTNVFFGVGKVQILEDKLADCYDRKTINNRLRGYFLDALFNTHNQFLEYLVLTGTVGFGLFLSVFITLFIKVRTNFYSTALLCLLFNFCCVENLFDIQLGSYFMGFTIGLILLLDKFFNRKSLQTPTGFFGNNRAIS